MNNQLFYILVISSIIGGSVLEFRITQKTDKKYYQLNDLLSSLKLLLGGFVVEAIAKVFVVLLMLQISKHTPLHLGFKWWTWLLCFFTWDFIHYLEHTLEHNVRFMWAIHINHHSSPFMNLSTAMRSGVFKVIYRYFFQIPIILLGFPISMFITIFAIGKLWGALTHSRYLGKWSVLGKFFITPEHHALHHSKSEQHYNRNFGEALVIWDKIFGTFQKNEGNLEYGIQEDIDHHNFSDVVMHELKHMSEDVRQAKNLKEKLMYVFGKPGWKPGIGQAADIRPQIQNPECGLPEAGKSGPVPFYFNIQEPLNQIS